MLLSEAIRDCRDYLRHELGNSFNTAGTYAAAQRQFARRLEEQGLPDPPVEQITANLVRRYSYSLSARQLRPRTVRSAMHGLRALFAFLQEMGLVPEQPGPGGPFAQEGCRHPASGKR